MSFSQPSLARARSSRTLFQKIMLCFFIIGPILLIVGGVFFFTKIHRQIWIAIDPSFSEVDRCNPGFEERVIRPGDVVAFHFQPGFTSINGYWSLIGVEFVPVDQSLGTWEGNDTRSGEFNKDGPMRLIDAVAKFQIPDEPSLEGKTVDGTLGMHMMYYIDWPPLWYKAASEDFNEPISIRIFTAEEAERFATLAARFDSVCLLTLAFCLIGGAVLLLIFFGGVWKHARAARTHG